MWLALEVAAAAAERGEVPVGAVIVDGEAGAVLARAGNQVAELDDPTAHAEMLAIRAAARESGAPRLPACDLYVTLEPCTMCAAAISFARLRRLYFGAVRCQGWRRPTRGALFGLPTCHHRPTVYGGFEETAAQALLRRFFTERR